MAVKLSFDERKWLLKCYWKVENVVEVQQRWRVEFGTPPPRVTITRIRDRLEVSPSHIQSEMDWTKTKCYGVPASISRFNLSRLLPLGNFKEHGARHKATTLEELRVQIEHDINDIPLVTIQTACLSFRRCCWECTLTEARHFEYARA